MSKLKTHQSIGKRFKTTKTGKLIKRKAGQGHFNAREAGSTTRSKRRTQTTSERIAKPLKILIPYSGKY